MQRARRVHPLIDDGFRSSNIAVVAGVFISASRADKARRTGFILNSNDARDLIRRRHRRAASSLRAANLSFRVRSVSMYVCLSVSNPLFIMRGRNGATGIECVAQWKSTGGYCITGESLSRRRSRYMREWKFGDTESRGRVPSLSLALVDFTFFVSSPNSNL